MEALEYTVVLHWDGEYRSYCVEVPALPGCVSQGKSKDDVLANIKQAIVLHLEGLEEDGEEIPREKPRGRVKQTQILGLSLEGRGEPGGKVAFTAGVWVSRVKLRLLTYQRACLCPWLTSPRAA